MTSLGTEFMPKVRGSLDCTHQPCKITNNQLRSHEPHGDKTVACKSREGDRPTANHWVRSGRKQRRSGMRGADQNATPRVFILRRGGGGPKEAAALAAALHLCRFANGRRKCQQCISTGRRRKCKLQSAVNEVNRAPGGNIRLCGFKSAFPRAAASTTMFGRNDGNQNTERLLLVAPTSGKH